MGFRARAQGLGSGALRDVIREKGRSASLRRCRFSSGFMVLVCSKFYKIAPKRALPRLGLHGWLQGFVRTLQGLKLLHSLSLGANVLQIEVEVSGLGA